MDHDVEEIVMQEPPPDAELRGRSPLPDAVRVQILATEHWSLLATRSMTWNELFTRASMFITVLSASVVALALVAQGTDFGDTFRAFALLVLPVTLVLGIGTMIRLGDAMSEDVWLVLGMNRLRRAYLDLAPDLEPYFITGAHDDIAGVLKTRGPGAAITPGRILSATPVIVTLVNAAIVGVIAALLVSLVTDRMEIVYPAGVVAGLAVAWYLVGVVPAQEIRRFQASIETRFPSDSGERRL
jgi:hypothetical protein